MKNSSGDEEPHDISMVAFHPKLTFRCKSKRLAQGAWYFALTLLFFCGLPALAVWLIQLVSKILDLPL